MVARESAIQHGYYSFLCIFLALPTFLPTPFTLLRNAGDRRQRDWTDLDFEEIHYDHAHLGIGTIGRRGWKINFLGGSSLALNAVHNNPDWGGGLLCLLRVPKASVVTQGEAIGAWALNTWSNLVGETAFGAWCTDGDDFVFVQFLPNFVRRLPRLTDLLIEWAIARSREIVHLVQCERGRLRSGCD